MVQAIISEPDRTRITLLDTGRAVPVAQLSGAHECTQQTGNRRLPGLPACRRPNDLGEKHSSHKFAGLDLVHVTPDPAFSRLDGANQGMLRFVKMLSGVLVLGRVATTNVSASEAQTQVNPRIAGLGAVLTHMFIGFSYLDLIKVRAFFWHRYPPDLADECFAGVAFPVPPAWTSKCESRTSTLRG
jgi:hypothetical protein